MNTPDPVRAFRAVMCWLLAPALAFAVGAESLRDFDVPAGEARETLKKFAAQAQVEIAFPSENTLAVRTNAIAGRLTAGDAIAALLRGTGLSAMRDAKTGGYAVRPAAPVPNAPRAPTADAAGARPQPHASAPDDPFVLSPFTVVTDKDTGYTATSTLAGSRLNTSLAVTPAAISVFTRDFLEDIGALSVNAAVEYALGASNDVERTGNNVTGNDFNYRIRGFLGGSAGRNYFPWALSSDSFNVERLDFSRGPNAILFGVGGPGGIINTTPKEARSDRALTAVRLRVGSWHDYRTEIDVNRPLGKTVAARINLLYQRADGWREFEDLDRKGAALAATWRPTATTMLRFDGEWGDVVQNKPRPFVGSEGYSQWRDAGSPISPNFGANVGGSSALGSRISFNPLGGADRGRAVNYTNFRRSNGATLVGVPNPPQIDDQSIHPRTVNLMGPGGETNFDYSSAGLFLSQRVGRSLFLELAANRQEEARIRHSAMNFNDNRLEFDLNAVLPAYNAAGVQTGTVANPNVGRTFVDGQYRTDENLTRRDDFRLTAAYELDLGRFGKHSLAALASRSDSFRESIERREVNVSAARQTADYNNANNTITRFTYIDLASGDLSLRGHHDPRVHPIADQPIAGTTFRVQSDLVRRNWSDTLGRIDTVMAAAQSAFFSDRLHTTLGARRDRVRNYSSVQTLSPTTNEALGTYRDGLAEADEKGNTFTLGAVGRLTRWVSVYYNKSENFQAQANTQIWSPVGTPRLAGNVQGEGQDYGLKFNLFDDRVSATAGYFQTAERNRGLSINGLYQIYFEGMWAAIGQPKDYNGGDTRSTDSTGYEVDLTANLTRQWRLAFNFNRTRTRESDLFPTIRAYHAANRATFAAQASRAVDTVTFNGARPTVGENLTAIDNQIAADTSTEGQSPRRHRENAANVFSNYRFDQGALKGVSLGFGAQYRGGAVVGYTTAGARVVSKGYTQANAMLGYERRIVSGRYRWRVQLNVDNLFDFDTPQPIDSGFDGSGRLVALRLLMVPRRYALTNTVSF